MLYACGVFAMLLTAALCTQAIFPNASFSNGLDGWSKAIYGATPTIMSDAAAHAVSIESTLPSDTALAQDVDVLPGELYSFSAEIKTVGLKPEDASVFGCLQVQVPRGGTVASGVNHRGDLDWTRDRVFFTGPMGGRAHLVLFFCGFGKGTGEAEFKNLRLDHIDPAQIPVRPLHEPLVSGRINPMQYGQFIEYLCDLVPGMWAEKLYDTSFVGLSPYKFVYLKENDFREQPWYPYGQTNRLKVSQDEPLEPRAGKSERIELTQGTACEGGIAQDGVSINKGVPCAFTGFVKGTARAVRLRLFHGPIEYASATCQISRDWSLVRADLKPEATDSATTFSISFEGPGVCWLDDVSLMPGDSVGGWRKDVVNVLRKLKPGVIRVGGSVMDDANLGSFEWSQTVGPTEKRVPFVSWGGLQPVGPGLEEVVQLIRSVGAEPLICVRYEKKTPADAAREVEYFNGSVSTPMGALRAQNGHPEPYHIKFWQVGNERWGEAYWRAVPAFCAAMRKADPGIRLLSSFPSDQYVEIAGQDLDFFCPHQYDVENLSGTADELADVRRMIREHGKGKALKVAVTEWNTTAGDAGPMRAKLWTLKNALDCSRYQNLLHRNADIVEIANRSNLTNSFCSGIIQTSRSGLYLTPTYYAQQLYATLAGPIPLKVVSDLPADQTPDISATLSEDGDLLTLFAVNTSLKPVTRPLDLSAFGNPGKAETWVLSDTLNQAMPDVTNSFETPERVVPTHRSLSLASTFTFAPLSLTVLRIRLR
jgi:alpha-N-arabinofuranosidase